ncbi:uncharacterized protein LOC143224680 [Tachypleus tridentatus]|uniref:uncharacterized protein LOC143224680 n=1 Tax=Tachypleus tridentatus TaxID=6853 RepID=UPI003FD1C503
MIYFSEISHKLTLILFIVKISWCQHNPEICVPQSGNPGPPPPEPMESYSTNIQINYMNEMISEEVIESVDRNKRMTTIEFVSGGERFKYIYSMNEEVVLHIHSNSYESICTTEKLFDMDPTDFFLQERILGPLGLLGSLVTALQSSGAGYYYLGPAFVKGTVAHQWDLCGYIEELKATVQVVISWTDSRWSPGFEFPPDVGTRSIPVQVVLRGKGKFQKDKNKSTDLNIVYDYSQFRPYVPSLEIFQPPIDVYCLGYKTNVPVPQLPDYFSYKSEIISFDLPKNTPTGIVYRKIYYDSKFNITQIEYNSKDPRLGLESEHGKDERLLIIHDFNTGVQYKLHMDEGTCNISDIQPWFPDVSTAQNHIIMSNPKEFLSLNRKNIVYNGKFYERGLPVDVFSSLSRVNEDIPTITQWFFTKNDSAITEGSEDERIELVKLISRPQTATGREGTTEINFYDFNKAEPSLFTYDITQCYNNEEMKDFLLIFPTQYFLELSRNMNLLKYRLLAELSKAARVHVLRLNQMKVKSDKHNLVVHFTLLDKPPLKENYENPNVEENDLEAAVEALQTTIYNSKFRVTVPLNTSFVVTLQPPKNGLKEVSSLVDKTTNDSRKGYTQGQVVGIGVGASMAGFVLGATLFFCYFKRHTRSTTRSSDEMKNPFDILEVGESNI